MIRAGLLVLLFSVFTACTPVCDAPVHLTITPLDNPLRQVLSADIATLQGKKTVALHSTYQLSRTSALLSHDHVTLYTQRADTTVRWPDKTIDHIRIQATIQLPSQQSIIDETLQGPVWHNLAQQTADRFHMMLASRYCPRKNKRSKASIPHKT